MTTKTAKPKLIRFQDQLSTEERKEFNPLADKLRLKHSATIARLDVLLDDCGIYVGTPRGIREAGDNEQASQVRLEIFPSDLTGDLRKDFVEQLSDSLGEIIRNLQTAKRRKGELPRPPVVAYQVVVDGEIIARYDDEHLAAYRMQGIGAGDVLVEFPDGSTEPSENSFVECIRQQMAKEAAAV